jgi:hypothetical protein
MKLDPVTLSAITMVIGWTMAFAGLKKNALERRRRRRRCPSCGRHIDGRTCDAHSPS